MTLNICMMVLLMFLNLVVADDNANQGMKYSQCCYLFDHFFDRYFSLWTSFFYRWYYFHGFLFYRLFNRFRLFWVSKIYLTDCSTIMNLFRLKYMKKTMSEPQYCIDDTISNKNGSEFSVEKNENHSQAPQLHQIQPILTVSEVISSVKQSLEDLDAALRPSNWSRVQRIYNQQNPVDEKIDFSVLNGFLFDNIFYFSFFFVLTICNSSNTFL